MTRSETSVVVFVVDARDSSPVGSVIVSEGELAEENPFQFSTKYRDPETELVYYGYRYLDAETGRWVSRDPVLETGCPNLYSMARNASVVFTDALGQLVAPGGEGSGSFIGSPGGTVGSSPWPMFGHYILGSGDLTLSEEAINLARKERLPVNMMAALVKRAEQQMRLTSCGESGIYSEMKTRDGFTPFHHLTGVWQLSMLGWCSWSCESTLTAIGSGACCCRCEGKCIADFTMSKTYTFHATPGGTPENAEPRFRFLDGAIIAIRAEAPDPEYHITGKWRDEELIEGQTCLFGYMQ